MKRVKERWGKEREGKGRDVLLAKLAQSAPHKHIGQGSYESAGGAFIKVGHHVEWRDYEEVDSCIPVFNVHTARELRHESLRGTVPVR